MSTQRNIILIGPPATGKSAVGEQLARALNRPFFDTDALIERARGATISEIFASEGESLFRQYETEALESLRRTQAMVLATGGGAVLAEANRALLRQLGVVVYLRVGLEAQAQRAARDDTRPLLSRGASAGRSVARAAEDAARYVVAGDAKDNAADDDKRLRDILRRLNAERAPLYEEIADLTIDTDDCAIADVARRIVASPVITPAA